MHGLDPIGSSFSIVHTETSLFGSQTHVVSGSMSCIGGVLQPVLTGGAPANPTPQCYIPGSTCPPNPDGSPSPNGICNGQPCFIVNDQWGPTVSFVRRGTTPQTLITWYDTRGDQNNNLAGVWGMSSNDFGTTWSAPFQVSSARWNETWSWWWDYQGSTGGPNGKFVAAWGGDARLGNGSALIQ